MLNNSPPLRQITFTSPGPALVHDPRLESFAFSLLARLPRPPAATFTDLDLPLIAGPAPDRCPLAAAARDLEGVTLADGVLGLRIHEAYTPEGVAVECWGVELWFDRREPHATYIDPRLPLAPQILEFLAETLLHLCEAYHRAGLMPFPGCGCAECCPDAELTDDCDTEGGAQ